MLNLKCRSCGAENESGVKFCVTCGVPLRSPGVPIVSTPPSSPAKSLRQSIIPYVNVGYRVIWHDDHSAQLVRPKQFNVSTTTLFSVLGPAFGALVALVSSVIGLLIIYFCFYLVGLTVLGYLSARDLTVYLYLDEGGTVQSIASQA